MLEGIAMVASLVGLVLARAPAKIKFTPIGEKFKKERKRQQDNHNRTMAFARRSTLLPQTTTKASSSAKDTPRRASLRQQNNFNPRLIFSQIVALQCFHYLILGFILQINHVFFNTSVTIDRIFSDRYLNLWKPKGWADNAAIMISYVVG